MEPTIVPLASRHYAAALADGIPDDTPEMRRRIVDGTVADLELMQQSRGAAPLRTHPGPTSPIPRSEPAIQTSPPPQVIAPARRPAPVAAPVVRSTPSYGGKPQSLSGQITVSAEERQIARHSFGLVNGLQLSDNEKERLYAANKAKYQRMVASGQYGGQG
jgi:hypothetical protein